MQGWTTQFSKTNNREYFVHTASGRRQWHKPDEDIENDRIKICLFYENLSHGSERPNMWRKFNNFLKVSIMKEFAYDLMCDYMEDFKYTVLDVGCGAGGDLGKWQNLGARSYVGFDISQSGINELMRRSASFPSLKISSFVGNFCSQETWDRISPGKKPTWKFFQVGGTKRWKPRAAWTRAAQNHSSGKRPPGCVNLDAER